MRALSGISVSIAALALGACGGGGGSVQFTPAPVSPSAPVTPPPPPAPPTPPPIPPGPLGLTGGPFVTAAATLSNVKGQFPATGTVARSGSDLVAISYSAAEDRYSLTLPDLPTGKLIPASVNGSFSQGKWTEILAVNYRFDAAGGTQPVSVYLMVPPDAGELKLTYTSSGGWSGQETPGPDRLGLFVYGVPTSAASMPVTGKASYVASAVGYTQSWYDIWGKAQLDFDFAQGSLTGKLVLDIVDGWDLVPLGTFTFRDTSYATGSTSYAGRLAVPGSDQTGSFSGQFTGPGGVELLGSFRSPAFNPISKTSEEIVGVWKGRKQ